MVKEKRRFRVSHQLGYFTSKLAVGDGNLVYCDRHWISPVGLIRPSLDQSIPWRWVVGRKRFQTPPCGSIKLGRGRRRADCDGPPWGTSFNVPVCGAARHRSKGKPEIPIGKVRIYQRIPYARAQHRPGATLEDARLKIFARPPRLARRRLNTCSASLFLGQLIRRTAIVGRQPTHRVDVDGLRSSRQPRRLHVFNHLQSQRRHRGLPWFEQASAMAPTPRSISSTQTPFGERRPYGEAVQSNAIFAENFFLDSKTGLS